MGKAKEVAELDAGYGEKMIEVKVRFWTDDLASSDGKILPKHARTSGVVRMERNKAHGIVPGKPLPFNSLLDLTSVIERVILDHSIRLHPSRRMRRYLAAAENLKGESEPGG